ncbi:MAG: DUF2079 domain-containing protein [Acidimicrobiales bacterium]|nr:DUF2079 domain-containing protein [Acidimicrobiales bacterium]
MARTVAVAPPGVGAAPRYLRVLPHVPVAALIAAYVVRFGLLSVQVYDGYGSPGYDMGIFDQGVWLLSRFHAPFVTINGRDLFGDHTSFVLLLAVPLYWIWPAAQTLLVLQVVLIAAAAVPVYLLALRRSRSPGLATALAAAYLLNPALQQGNLEQFHPESFLVLFVALAVYAAVEWSPRLLIGSVIGCLLVKEDAALLIIPLGLWVYFRRDRVLGVGIVVGALAYAVVAFKVVIAILLGTDSFYADRIPFGGLAGLAAAPFVHIGKFVKYTFGGYRPFYMWQMGFSFGWGFLVAPEIAAIGLLTLAENMLSDFPYMQQINYHYSLPLVPVFALGTAFTVTRLATPGRRAAGGAYVAGAALLSCWLWGLAPFSRTPVYPHSAPASAEVRAVNRALEAVPPDAVVSADYPFVAHLDHRTRAYQWPTPFRANYWGLYKQESQRLPFAGQIQYLVIRTDLPPDDARTFASIANQFTLVARGGGVSVYRRATRP